MTTPITFAYTANLRSNTKSEHSHPMIILG